MIKILFVINTLVTIIALASLVIEINNLKYYKCNIIGIRYIYIRSDGFAHRNARRIFS